mmetsp:Transcript_33788/g.109185  ORF Transcript_33788/g.109185 Transcript_33788/m.109185 type:complete len:233 (+) Transcript_33788:311-1009(+)
MERRTAACLAFAPEPLMARAAASARQRRRQRAAQKASRPRRDAAASCVLKVVMPASRTQWRTAEHKRRADRVVDAFDTARVHFASRCVIANHEHNARRLVRREEAAVIAAVIQRCALTRAKAERQCTMAAFRARVRRVAARPSASTVARLCAGGADAPCERASKEAIASRRTRRVAKSASRHRSTERRVAATACEAAAVAIKRALANLRAALIRHKTKAPVLKVAARCCAAC